MHLTQQFRADLDASSLTGRITQYFLALGYRQTNAQSPSIFERGSVLGSLISFSPRGWQAKVTVVVRAYPSHSEAEVDYEINTTGQLVTGKERAFWEAELQTLDTAIQSGHPVTSSREFATSALAHNLGWLVTIIGLMVVASLAAFVIFESSSAARLGAYLGAFVGFAALAYLAGARRSS